MNPMIARASSLLSPIYVLTTMLCVYAHQDPDLKGNLFNLAQGCGPFKLGTPSSSSTNDITFNVKVENVKVESLLAKCVEEYFSNFEKYDTTSKYRIELHNDNGYEQYSTFMTNVVNYVSSIRQTVGKVNPEEVKRIIGNIIRSCLDHKLDQQTIISIVTMAIHNTSGFKVAEEAGDNLYKSRNIFMMKGKENYEKLIKHVETLKTNLSLFFPFFIGEKKCTPEFFSKFNTLTIKASVDVLVSDFLKNKKNVNVTELSKILKCVDVEKHANADAKAMFKAKLEIESKLKTFFGNFSVIFIYFKRK